MTVLCDGSIPACVPLIKAFEPLEEREVCAVGENEDKSDPQKMKDDGFKRIAAHMLDIVEREYCAVNRDSATIEA